MPSTIQPELKLLFEFESIAVIGASIASNKWDNWMVTRPIHSGYCGRICLVNPKEEEEFGLNAFPYIGPESLVFNIGMLFPL